MMSWLLTGIGGVTLLLALILKLVNRTETPSEPSHHPDSTQMPEEHAVTGSDASTGRQLDRVLSLSDTASAEATEIEWEDSTDVYAPIPVEAQIFVSSLGLAGNPDILPKQSYLFVKRTVLARMDEHLKKDVSVESGGLLLGEAFFDPTLNTYLLVIHEALPAPDGIETPTFFGYTTASWRALLSPLQQMDASWTIIGSYHSHPDMGVFLSATDLSTQEDIFAADWQVAAVVDPVRNEIGFFVGKEGTPCGDWYPI